MLIHKLPVLPVSSIGKFLPPTVTLDTHYEKKRVNNMDEPWCAQCSFLNIKYLGLRYTIKL